MIVVTGGSGFIGTNLVRSLLELNHKVLVVEDKEKVDNTNPSVTITYPFNLSVVSEIVQISCAAADNDSLKKVVLWINGAETEIAAKVFIDSSQIPLLLNRIKYVKHVPPNKANLQPFK